MLNNAATIIPAAGHGDLTIVVIIKISGSDVTHPMVPVNQELIQEYV